MNFELLSSWSILVLQKSNFHFDKGNSDRLNAFWVLFVFLSKLIFVLVIGVSIVFLYN